MLGENLVCLLLAYFSFVCFLLASCLALLVNFLGSAYDSSLHSLNLDGNELSGNAVASLGTQQRHPPNLFILVSVPLLLSLILRLYLSMTLQVCFSLSILLISPAPIDLFNAARSKCKL